MSGRAYRTEAIILRSLRFSEADRILHLYTLERGRLGAIAKGARKTTSRFGARLEPLSHVELILHEGPRGAALARRAHPARGIRRAAHGDGSRADRLPPRRARGRPAAGRRADRRRGDAGPLPRGGAQPARLQRARALPRGARGGRRG